MTTYQEGFCLHKHRKIAVAAFVFFAYLFVRQMLRLIGPPHLAPFVHPNFRMSLTAILGEIACAVGIFLALRCTVERIVLGLVLIDSLGELAALFVRSPLYATEYRIFSTVIVLTCAVITGGLAFRPRKEGDPR